MTQAPSPDPTPAIAYGMLHAAKPVSAPDGAFYEPLIQTSDLTRAAAIERLNYMATRTELLTIDFMDRFAVHGVQTPNQINTLELFSLLNWRMVAVRKSLFALEDNPYSAPDPFVIADLITGSEDILSAIASAHQSASPSPEQPTTHNSQPPSIPTIPSIPAVPACPTLAPSAIEKTLDRCDSGLVSLGARASSPAAPSVNQSTASSPHHSQSAIPNPRSPQKPTPLCPDASQSCAWCSEKFCSARRFPYQKNDCILSCPFCPQAPSCAYTSAQFRAPPTLASLGMD